MKKIDCPRCDGFGRLPMGVCSICDGQGHQTDEEIRKRFKSLKESYDKTFGPGTFTIPKGWD